MVCCLQATAAVRGDVNGDNTVDVSDINIVINKVLGKGGPGNTDVNGDGTTDVSDINIVINIVLGKDVPETHEYVDLGLPGGVLWATCNVGAEKPEDYGLNFAWGETTGYTKDEEHKFSWSNYKYCNGSAEKMTKYSTSTIYWDPELGTSPDGITVLEAMDDAATANWGDEWRMPSLQEVRDLTNTGYTTTEWVTVNGVSGRKITSRSNGNSIFIPAAGYRTGNEYYRDGTYGYCWARELYSGIADLPCNLSVYENSLSWNVSNRYEGLTVRPVRVNAK